MKKEITYLIAIFFIAVFLRFYKLSTVPLGLYVDEAAIGYNSYSIALTGKDEYGKSFPVYFRSFGDYKMPLYIYLSTIPIGFFGLNVFSVRFLSALSGSLMIFIVYFLVKNLFPKERKLSLLVALLFAVLPWTVFLSRMALEMQLGLFLLLLAIFFHQKALQNFCLKWWFLTVVFYALSAYAYHTEKLIAPLIFILWSLMNYPGNRKKEKWDWWKKFLLAAAVLIVLLWPQLKLSFSPGANTRMKNLSYFQDRKNIPYGNDSLMKLRKWGATYTAYFSPRNLFYNPDPDFQRSLPGLSVLYSWMVIPFFVGIYILAKNDNSVGKKLTVFLLLISPLPASLTKDPFSTFRAFPLVFPLCILISLGILKIMTKINRIIFLAVGSLFFLGSLGLLWRSLFILLPNERFYTWKYGYAELVYQINKVNAPKVLLDDPVGVSYSEMLFFQNYNPALLQKERKIDLGKYYQLTNWEGETNWDKYEVRSISWIKDVYEEKLIVATPLAISDSQAKEHFLTKNFAIIGPDNKVILNGYLTNPEIKRLDNERKLKLQRK